MPRKGRYRGRRRIARLLGFVGIFLVIASVLSVTGFLFLRDYITRTDDGLLLSLPFLNSIGGRASPSPEPYEPEDDPIDLIVEPPPSPTPTPSPTPGVVEVSAPVTISPAFLPQRYINREDRIDELIALCESGDIDTIIIEVKSVSGIIATPGSLEAVAERVGERAKLVAYFSVLEDNSVTRMREGFGIKHTSGVNWLDANRSRWINPYVPEAREWLAAQLSAVDQEIFSAVLIDNLWFPPDGRLEVMVLDATTSREDIIKTLRIELTMSTTLPFWEVFGGEIRFEGNKYADFPQGAFE
jgi:hypothetical protein